MSDGMRPHGAEMQAGVQAGPPPPRRAPRTVERCDRCFAELYLAERGPDSTSLACPNHGFDRLVLSIPVDLEDWARRHPKTTRAYAEWLTATSESWEQIGLATEPPGLIDRCLTWLGVRG